MKVFYSQQTIYSILQKKGELNMPTTTPITNLNQNGKREGIQIYKM